MLPPLPQVFEDAAWRYMTEFSQTTGGEGRGEGAALERCDPRKPPHPAYRPPSPPEGRRDPVSHGKSLAVNYLGNSESPNLALSS
jgi:hypothetical protein